MWSTQKIMMCAFMAYTFVVYYAKNVFSKALNVVVALSPDGFNRCLHEGGVTARKNAPSVITARGYSSKTGTTHNITNFIIFFLTQYWDSTACDNEGGISLQKLRDFAAMYRIHGIDLIWICYRIGKLSPNEKDPLHMLINIKSEPFQIYKFPPVKPPWLDSARETAREKYFHEHHEHTSNTSNIKNIIEPMFDEISFLLESKWN